MKIIRKNLLYAWELISFRGCLKSTVAPNTTNNSQANDSAHMIDEDTVNTAQDWMVRRSSLHDICI